MNTGHPRTLQAHKEMQMRDVQRGEQSRSKPVADRSGLHVDIVVGVDENGDVRLQRFSNESLNGTTFSALNHSSPKIGDTVIYAYADETPIMLGKMPDYHTLWRAPEWSNQDTFFLEDFDFSGGTLGTHGIHNWTGTGTVNLTAGAPTYPGVLEIISGTSIGSLSYAHPKAVGGLVADSLWQCGFGIVPIDTVGACQSLVGLVDNGATLANYIAVFDSNGLVGEDGYWHAATRLASGTPMIVTTNIPSIDGHRYRIAFRRASTGHWFCTVADVDNEVEATVSLFGAPATSPLFPYVRNYPNIATTARTLCLDYAWWARKGISR